MQITYLGNAVDDSLFIGDAFFDNNGSVEGLDVLSVTSTEIVISNPDTGITTTLGGTGITLTGPAGQEEVTGGTITSATMVRGGDTIGSITDISWNFVSFVDALDDIEFSDDLSGIAALINSSGPITVDASGASAGFEMRDYFDFDPVGFNLSDLITQPMTVTGTDFRDFLVGGQGNDSINPGANDDTGDEIIATAGNDTIDFGDASDVSYYLLNYNPRFNGIQATLDTGTGDGTVQAGGFTDTIVNLDKATWGLDLAGTVAADTFTVTTEDDSFIALVGWEGSDTFNLTLNGGTTRLNQWGATQAVMIDLGAGTLQDGYGFTDTLNITYNGGRIDARGTDFDDTLIGSDESKERFITEQGNDTVDGKGGYDVLRYDRSGVDAMNVNLGAGTASGTWDGNAFTDTISNIEEVRGSRQGDDTLTGADADERLDGRGGADSLNGKGGNDTLIGDEGNDTLKGGSGDDRLEDGGDNDTVQGGAGNDTLIGGGGDDLYEGGSDDDLIVNIGGGSDVFDGGSGNDTLETDVTGLAQDVLEFNATTGVHGRLNSTLGQDQVTGIENFRMVGEWDASLTGDREDNHLQSDLGNDTLDGDRGNDTLEAGEGTDLLEGGKGNDLLDAGRGNDTMDGGKGNDTLDGGKGSDRMKGGSGRDDMSGGSGNDRLDGGSGKDVLNAGSGADRLTGGSGNDRMKGGSEADTFIFKLGHDKDRISDFDAGEDILRLASALTDGETDAAAILSQFGSQQSKGVLLDFGDGDTILLQGLTLQGLTLDIEVF